MTLLTRPRGLLTAPVNLELWPNRYSNHVLSSAGHAHVIDGYSDCYFGPLSQNVGARLYASAGQKEGIVPMEVLEIGRAGISRAGRSVNVSSFHLRKHPQLLCELNLQSSHPIRNLHTEVLPVGRFHAP